MNKWKWIGTRGRRAGEKEYGLQTQIGGFQVCTQGAEGSFQSFLTLGEQELEKRFYREAHEATRGHLELCWAASRKSA